MADNCLTQIKGKVIRLTRLETTGRTKSGATASVVFNAFTSLVVTSEYDEGEEVLVRNADGDLCVNYREKDKLKRITFELAVCQADPYVHEILAGGELTQNGDGRGYAWPEVGTDPTPDGVSLEIWARNVDESGAPDPDFRFAWWVLPRIYGRHGVRRFQLGPQDVGFSGYGIQNSGWYDGPENDHPDPTITSRVASWVPTTDTPEASCGYSLALAS